MSNNLVGEIADAILAAAEANKASVLPALATLEGGVEGVIFNAIKNAPHGSGPMAVIFPLIQGEIEAAIKAYVAANGPDVVFKFLDGYAHDFAKSLGG